MDIENGEVLPVEDKKVKKEEPTVPAEESGDRKDAGSATEGVPEVKVKMEPEENVKGEPIEEKIEGTKVPEQGVGDAKIRFPSPVFSSRPAKTSLMLSELSYRTGPTIDLYPLENYTFDSKPPEIKKDKTVTDRLLRMEANYKQRGRRETVEGVLITHDHGFPHVLLLQINSAFFKLPGGRLRPGENEVDGLKRKLTNRLASIHEDFRPKWEIGDLLSVWYRPTFEPYHYPYNPPHVTAPKERRRLFLIPLPEKCLFVVPSNLKLRAVPLFELYDNANRYGPVISSLPQLLSRFHFNINR
ncbi:hypothetical protein AAMO2058_001191300 [Amorphochlora amoebiformis]